MVRPGGFYIIDDMNPADSWPDGHAEKAKSLRETLQSLPDFHMVELNWSTGLIIAVRK